MIQHIPVEMIEEKDDSEMEGDEVFSDLELLSYLAISEPYIRVMEQMELLSDDDNWDNSLRYQYLFCLKDMETIIVKVMYK